MKLAFWKKSDKPSGFIAQIKSENSSLIYKIIFGLIIFGIIFNFVLLFLANNKITSMRENNEVIFETLNRAASIMDKNSGTTYSKEITADALKNKDTFEQTISLIAKQSANIIKERDTLAKTLSSISSSIDAANSQKDLSLTNISSYEISSEAVSEMVKKMIDTNSQLASFIADTAEIFKVPIPNKSSFIASAKLNPDQNVLKLFSDSALKATEQINSLKQDIELKDAKINELNSQKLNESDQLRKLFNEQKKELEKLRLEHDDLKSKASKGASAADEDDDDQDLQEAADASGAPNKVQEVRNIFPEFYYKLSGSVVEFNSKWGFVIINIGSDSKLTIDIDGTKREVTVPTPFGQEIYISRGDRFIAKAKIANVYSKYSVANVIFPTNDEIQKGDSIFFDQPKSNLQDNIK